MTDVGVLASRRDRIRRALRWVRIGLAVVFVLTLVGVELTWESRPQLRYQLEYVNIAALVLIPLGGLLWWPVRTSPDSQRAELIQAVGRWIRAILGTVGIVMVVFVPSTLGLAAGAAIAAGSLLATALDQLAWPGGRPAGTPADLRRTYARRMDRDRQLGISQEPAAIEHENLVTHGRWPAPRPCTVRPSVPDGERPRLGKRRWLRNGALSTDGRSVSVTDRTGHVWTLPLRPAENGVAGLVVMQETVEFRTITASVPERYEFEHLSLVNSERERLLDIELYGWTPSVLTRFAETAGLTLDWYWTPGPQVRYMDNWRRKGLTPLEARFPPAVGYRRLVSRRLIPDWLVIGLGASFGILLCLALISWALA